MRLTTLNSVVFPAPLGPMSPQICPRSTLKDRSLSATMPPKRTEISLMSSNVRSPE